MSISLDLEYSDHLPVCPEDSALGKAISYIPLIGLFTGYFMDLSITGQISDRTLSTDRLIELVKVKNEFKKALVVNSLICLAAVVSGIALKILTMAATPLIGFLVGFGGMTLYGLYENKKTIEKVKADSNWTNVWIY